LNIIRRRGLAMPTVPLRLALAHPTTSARAVGDVDAVAGELVVAVASELANANVIAGVLADAGVG
jgi:hypothetical protein